MNLKALQLSIKAFEQLRFTSKNKREIYICVLEQLKPLLPLLIKYMKENHILAFEFNLRTKRVLALEPICNGEKEAWLRLWLNNEVSSRQLQKRMKQRFQWVEYLSFSDFLEGVESWLRGDFHG